MSPRLRCLVRLPAVIVLVTAAGALGPPSALASTCTDAGGVSVVVDFRELGGGLQTTCDPSGGGRTAAALFTGNGFPITYAQRQPGFVCRVAGVPTTDPCVNTSPADAYWGLYWSDGTSGSWSYSTLGATSLTVPASGSVGFAWQGESPGEPGVAPPAFAASPSPSPTKTPSPSPTKTPSTSPPSPPSPPSPTSPTRTPTKAPTPSQSPTPTRALTTTQSPAPGATPSSTPDAGQTTSAPSRSRGATPDPTPSAPPKRDRSSRSAEPTPSGPTPSGPTDPGDRGPTDAPVAQAPDPGDPAGTGSVPLPLVVAALGLLGALVSGAAVLRRRRLS